MTRSARLAWLSWAGFSLFAPGVEAADERLCGLKHIEQTGNGVSLSFTAPRQVILMHEQESDLYVIDAGAQESEGSETAPKRLRALPLREGEEAVVRNSGDERCSITVAHRNGRIGVEIGLSGPGWEGKRGASQTTPKSTTAARYEKFLPAD